MRTRLVVATLIAVLALAGCGTSAITARQLRAKAARPCRLAQRQLSVIPAPALPDGAAEFLARGIAALAPKQAALARLRPSGSLGDSYRRALAAGDGELAALRSAAAALRAGDDPVQTVRRLQLRLTPLEARATTAWRELGLPACIGT
ncbi:MAG: hypothetical protein ACRDMJ_20235 [Solirubrobacteraceae bacterium]